MLKYPTGYVTFASSIQHDRVPISSNHDHNMLHTALSSSNSLLLNASGARQLRHVHTGERPPARECLHLLLDVLHLRRADLALLGHARDAHEVLQELAARLLLEHERGLHRAVQELRDDLHVLLAHVARRQCGRAEADAPRHLRGRVAGHRVLVDRDADEVAELLELRAGEAERAQVPEDEVVVRARGLELVAALDELLAEGGRVRDDLLGVRLPGGLARLKEGSSDTGDGLQTRESAGV